jgi:hypothetical protein
MGVQESGQAEEKTSLPPGEGGKARRTTFYVLLVLLALLHIALNLMPYVILGWFLEEGAVSHRVHLIIFGWAFVLSFVGLLVHFRRPQIKVAQMYQVLIVIAFLLATTVLVDRLIDMFVVLFLVIPPLLFILHPNRSALLHPRINVSRTLLALALVAAVPLVVDSFVQIRIGLNAARVAPDVFDQLEDLDDDISDEEFERELNAAARRLTDSREEAEEVVHFGHWSAMGSFNLILAGLALMAALRPPGWRLPAWSAGLSAILFGLASVANPGDASALNGYWSVLAIAWGIGFIVVAEASRRESEPDALVSPKAA